MEAYPKRRPLLRASRVLLPMGFLGGVSSMVKSLAAFSERACMASSMPGMMAPPRYWALPSAFLEMAQMVVAVPESTTMQGEP